ncbi:MAG TPA: cupredoxin domain-containing protein [Anaerolineales bacterium]
MKRIANAFGTAIALCLIVSGCSPATASTNVSLTMTDFSFLPNTITVPAGQEITIDVTNSGAVAHDLMIMQAGYELVANQHVHAEEHGNAYWEQDLLEPGHTLTSTFLAPSAPGEYQIVCGVPGHFEAGMVGKLLVVASQ